MKSYLVDFENVKSKGLFGIENLTADDHVVIFYSENSDTISFEMHCSVMRAAATVEYMKVNVGGKNALDFQLSTLLGYMVAQNCNTHIFIISNDKGFDKLHDFWENTFTDGPNCSVYRTHNIAAAINYAKNRKAFTEEPQPEEEVSEIAETAEETTDARSMSAQIVVVPQGTQAPAVRRGEQEPKFIVPEPMVEKFRNGDGRQGRENSVKKQNRLAYRDKDKKTEEFIKKAKTVTNTESPAPDPEPLFPACSLPDDEPRGAAYYREMEFKSMEPAFERFLESPEAEDKHELLKKYLHGADDETVDEIAEMIINASCRSELRNFMMKRFDERTAESFFEMIKPNFDFFKRVLPEPKEGGVIPEIFPEEVSAEAERANVSAEGEGAQKTVSASATEPKKADAAMKKKLHSLLDEKATTDEFSGIVAQINRSATSRQLYINMVRRFGKERGCELYKIVKDDCKRFIGDEGAEDKEKPRQKKTEEPAEPKKVDAAMKKRLHALLDEKATADEFSGIVAQINQSADDEQLRSNMALRFGNDRGGELYEIIKDAYSRFVRKTPPRKPRTAKSPTVGAAASIDAQTAEKLLRESMGDEMNDGEMTKAVGAIVASAGRHELYLGMIKKLGKKRGLAIYNRIKDGYERLASAENA